MGNGTDPRTQLSGSSSCAYLAFEVASGSAHKVQILETCDALTSFGVDTELLMYPDGAETPSASELRQLYELGNTPRISWIPRDGSKWVARLRLVVESSRAGHRCAYIYTRRAVAALGALLGGARHVFLEIHQSTPIGYDRVALRLVGHSKRLHIVCVSRRLAEIIARRYGLEESALIVEHNGASFPILDDYSVDSGASRRLRAMYVGTFAAGRGLGTIFDLAALHPTVDFVVVGGQAPAGRLPDNVAVRGPVPHAAVPELLSQADILLMPYTRTVMLSDGVTDTAEYCSPLKMIEYLSAGRSIIASNLPSIAEILVHESNCLLVDPESVEEWSAAMGRLERDPRLRVLLAHGAAETAGRHTILGRVQRILEHAGAAE